jgi:PTS system mannose-specific IIC component
MITSTTVLLAAGIALLTGICFVVLNLGMNMWGPLLYGILAGCVVGDINLGVVIGATCTLFSLGFYTYNSSTVMPDFSIGALFGVFAASGTATIQGINAASDHALVVAAAVAVLMILFDILGRSVTTFFFHAGNNALIRRDLVSFQRWHVAATVPLGLSRAIPVFIGMLFINEYREMAQVINGMEWLNRGLGVAGAALPAVGFALILTRMKLSSYWPYILMGYLLFAYVHVPLTGLAIAGAACAGLYMRSKKGQVSKGGK